MGKSLNREKKKDPEKKSGKLCELRYLKGPVCVELSEDHSILDVHRPPIIFACLLQEHFNSTEDRLWVTEDVRRSW